MQRRGRRRQWDVALVVAVGGSLGAAARYGLGRLWPTSVGGFPWATFTENVLGALLIGILMVLLLDVRPPSRYARPFLATGVLGGFTTFSAYAVDTHVLVRADRSATAVVYLVGTMALGLVAAAVGLAAARRLTGVARPHGRSAS